jgi:hypothetical protein
MLTDRDLIPPKHHIALTQVEVNLAVTMLSILEHVRDDITAKMVFGQTMGGYPIDYHFAEATRAFCRHLIAEWEAGKLYTSPTHLFGVDVIRPHPEAHYDKPILVLTNGLCFSGGDFFPAILQDNRRATILGTRTAGAGGYVLSVSYPNLMGVRSFHLTGSLAERSDSSFLENLGVKPDIECALTERDFQDNYQPYVTKILQTLCTMVK